MKNLKILLGLVIFSVAALVITGLALNYLGIQHGPFLVKIGITFIIVNIVLYLLILIFSVIRNLFSVYREKKEKTISSKFRTQLIIAFVSLTLIPSALLFILSNQLINNSIDTWFSMEARKPIFDSMDLARIYYSQQRVNTTKYAKLLASNTHLLETQHGDFFTDNYRKFMYSTSGVPKSDAIRRAFEGLAETEIVSDLSGDIIRAAAPVYEGESVSDVVVVEKLIPKDIVRKLESITKAYNDFNQISAQQEPIRFIYFLMLTIATLVIIFLALWISLRIAKSITIPIRSLAEATKIAADGNLDFRIDLDRDDEIGLLINSFNKMLEDLKTGKLSLEKTYREADRRRLSMEAILESINSGVIFFDRTGKIANINSAACSLLGIECDSIMGMGHKELVGRVGSDDLNYMVRYLGEKGLGSVEKEVHLYIKGRPMDFRVFITTLQDSAGNFIGTVAVFDNLTEIILAQRALAWQEVAKRVAHEIKNPLTPIRLSAERLQKTWNERTDNFDDIIKRSTGTIIKQVNSLRSLVDEFSKFGKLPKMSLEPTDVRHIISEVVELYSHTRDISIFTSLQDTPTIEIDREQIKRVLINLIDNAIQAKTENIWIRSEYHKSMDIIRIEVIDEGVGISEANKEKLFLPYFSTRKEGTGLGLAIVNSIVSKHRGYIRVQDNTPKGSRFLIELPVRQN